MTARSIRRAQERKARKLARKEANAQEKQPVTPLISKQSPERSDRVDASSTSAYAPVTADTAPALLNLQPYPTRTGSTVLLPPGEAANYERHVQAYHEQFQPVTPIETAFVQSAADAHWRILRFQNIEMAFYARGRSEFAAKFEQEDRNVLPGLCDLETFLVYGKQLRHLELQENRLHRQREKDLAELRRLQDARLQAGEAALLQAETNRVPVTQAPLDADPERELHNFSTKRGFEFSNDIFKGDIDRLAAAACLASDAVQAATLPDLATCLGPVLA